MIFQANLSRLRVAAFIVSLNVVTLDRMSPTFADEVDRPNVVLIISDDQGWTDYGFMGHQEVETPNLDRLASQSLVFRRGYVTSALCRPSLASMVTGLYPHQHGVTGNDVDGMNRRAKLDLPLQKAFHRHRSLIRELVKAGYLAHQSGKWWEGSYRDGGFTHGMTHGDPSRGGRHGDAGLKIGRNGVKPITDFIDMAMAQSKPFLVWYAPFMPHTPHDPPASFLKKYQRGGRANDVANYYAMCEWFDATCGELLDHLEKRKLTKETIVVYICDNGWAARSTNADDPRQKQWRGFALRSKGSPFELGIRTPILIRWPGRVTPNASDELAQSIDLYPTLARACGIQSPDKLPGIDLLDQRARRQRTTVFGSMHSIHNLTPGNPDETLQYHWCIDGNHKLVLRFQGKDTTRYKKVHDWDRQEVRLYDLAKDPRERANMAGDEPETVRKLTGKIDRWHSIRRR